MRISVLSNLEEVAREISRLDSPAQRARLYNSMTIPAGVYLLRQILVKDRYFSDKTGNLRDSAIIVKGSTRYPTTLTFTAPHAHLVDRGSIKWSGTNFVQRLINENITGTAREAVAGGRKGWNEFARKINNRTKNARLKML